MTNFIFATGNPEPLKFSCNDRRFFIANLKLRLLTMPFSKAELTIYYFYHGRRYVMKNFNCRCVSKAISKSEFDKLYNQEFK